MKNNKHKNARPSLYGFHAVREAWLNPERQVHALYLTDQSKQGFDAVFKEGKEEVLNEIVEAERQILLWERKIQLEKEMQILEKCLEDMKAVYRLNEEKLQFNYTVLKEREKVNTNTIRGLRNKERRNRDILKTVYDKSNKQS